MNARMILCAVALSALAPAAADAQHGGGGHGGGERPAMPAQRQAAPMRQVPAPVHQAPAQPRGFDLNDEVRAQRAPASAPVRPGARPPSNGYRPPAAGAPGPDIRTGGGGRRTIANPARRDERAWQWNRGVAWVPAPAYWGGGFWGPFALGALAAAAFGTIAYDGTDFTSYQIAPDSPGATLLQNYGLTQTPCGPPNLVVIFGPDDSVICAYPNATVAPGEYDLDPSTLTIVSQQ